MLHKVFGRKYYGWRITVARSNKISAKIGMDWSNKRRRTSLNIPTFRAADLEAAQDDLP